MSTLNHQLLCNYSGLPIGKLELQVVAGHVPYLSHWKEMACLHPVFSLETHKRLAFVRSEWNRLAKASTDSETTVVEEHMLQVGFLAVLHSLESIQQEIPALPPIHIVHNNMSRLFALAYWYYHLQSTRFSFAKYKISKVNNNGSFANISDYLDVCFQMKEDYESGMEDINEAEKIASAERATIALRNSWIVPVGNKALFRWVAANLPDKYDADKQGWMGTLFCGSERTILDFDKEDIELLIEIIQGECPIGTTIMHAVRERLDKIEKIYTDNKEAFTVDFDDYEEDQVVVALRVASGGPAVLAAPKPSDFATKVEYIRANARYYLQQRAIETKSTGGL